MNLDATNPCHITELHMDLLRFEPGAFHTRGGYDTTTRRALEYALPHRMIQVTFTPDRGLAWIRVNSHILACWAKSWIDASFAGQSDIPVFFAH